MTDVLDFKENKSGANFILSYHDTVNSLGQRTGVEQAGTAFASARAIQWGYDSLGQVTSADHSDTAHSRYYGYDAIGNRNESRRGTATDSGGIATTYSSNALNQYTGINSTAGNPNINPVHDLDGNQTTGPLAVDQSKSVQYIWDAENRLIEAKVDGSTVGTYRYDAQGRRIYKNGFGDVRYFIYDDWNLIAEYSVGNLIRSHTWGTDLSGSFQGAGGVGGLLASRIGGVDYYPLYDGNGNVTEYRDAASTVAHFEYDAFGAVSSFTGPMWDFNIRFSSKYEDFETGLNYYGYRYYDPKIGRWLSRDPLGELGGLNLFGFGPNSPLNGYDPNGGFWSWGGAAAGAGIGAIGGIVATVVHAGVNAVQGQSYDFGRNLANNVATGAFAGAVGGALAGALTGDPTAAAAAALLWGNGMAATGISIGVGGGTGLIQGLLDGGGGGGGGGGNGGADGWVEWNDGGDDDDDDDDDEDEEVCPP
jgi:RHS repeat-associated protein